MTYISLRVSNPPVSLFQCLPALTVVSHNPEVPAAVAHTPFHTSLCHPDVYIVRLKTWGSMKRGVGELHTDPYVLFIYMKHLYSPAVGICVGQFAYDSY